MCVCVCVCVCVCCVCVLSLRNWFSNDNTYCTLYNISCTQVMVYMIDLETEAEKKKKKNMERKLGELSTNIIVIF